MPSRLLVVTELWTWLAGHSRDVAIAAAVAIATAVVLAWLRRVVTRWIDHLDAIPEWRSTAEALRALLRPSWVWIGLLALTAASAVLPLEPAVRGRTQAVLLTLLALSLGIAAVRFARDAVRRAGAWLRASPQSIRIASTIAGALVGFVTALVVLPLWGVPTAPLLVVSVLLAVLALVALRDLLPTAVASLQVAARAPLENGDYLRLDSGEEGTVERSDWREVVLRGVDGSSIHVPQTKLVRATIHRSAGPRRAAQPLRFVERSHLRELTGIRARNIAELVDGMRRVPDSSIYYHTHQYLEQHQYLVPSPTNELAEWVGRVLGLAPLAEALGAVDVLATPTLAAVRERLIGILEEGQASGVDDRTAPPGQELYFLRSITVVTPCPYTASTLPELAAAVRRLSHGSLFYHLFEARLVSGGAERDLATWLRRSLGASELAAEIGRFNPYDYTLESLRAAVVARVEAHR